MEWKKISTWKFWGNTDTVVDEPSIPTTIDVMKGDVDPNEVTIENAYKTRWIWYHTILALEILMTNLLLFSILIILAVKL